MKGSVVFAVLTASLAALSCNQDGSDSGRSGDFSFGVTEHILEGKRINCIAADNKGNAWIGSGKTLFLRDSRGIREYEISWPLIDIAVSPDGSVWLGSDGGGLGHFENGNVTWYNSQNSGLPRDVVMNVEVGKSGDVWFSSSAFRIGGLGHWDGRSFEFFTPENSDLNQNIIGDIEIDDQDQVYIASAGTVGKSNIYRLTGKSFKCLGIEEGTFYWIFQFSTGPKGNIYVVEDFSLSSTMQTNKVYRYVTGKWYLVETDDIDMRHYFTRIEADNRGYIWMGGQKNDKQVLWAFDGVAWHSSPEDLFSDVTISVIESDADNTLWIGTFDDGVFIIDQAR